jgi:hypothetical protein
MNIIKSLFKNVHSSLEKFFASTRVKVLSILLMDFVKNATTR